MLRRVVITGLGAVSPNGIGLKTFWKNTCNGISGIDRITSYDPSALACQIAGEVTQLDPSIYFSAVDLNKLPRSIPLAVAATQEALAHAGIDLADFSEEDFEGLGVLVGSGGSGFDFSEKQFEIYFSKQKNRISPYAISNSLVGMLSSEISMYFGLQGRSHVLSNGCTSSTDALGYAFNAIRFGQEDWFVSGGVESCVTPAMMQGFERMKVNPMNFNDSPTRGSRPFNLDREGFVLAEGSWMIILEELEHAKKRGAHMYAELIGYGLSGDAHHITAPAEDGNGAQRCMEAALKRAGANPEDIDYINAHGTSTPLGDEIELAAVERVFGDHSNGLSMSSTKSAIGHLLGAAGAVESIFSILAMRDGVVPPTLNLDNPSVDSDIDLVPHQAKEHPVKTVLSNSFGFGGTNASLVFKSLD